MGTRTVCAAIAVAAVSVAWARPVSAETMGIGGIAGEMTYGYPGDFLQPCSGVDWDMSATVASAHVQLANDEVAGPGSVTGSGSTTCYTDESDSGPVSLSASVTGPTGLGQFVCPSLTGTYDRAGDGLRVTASGTCTINGTAVPGVVMSISAATSGGDNAFDFLVFAGTVTFSG